MLSTMDTQWRIQGGQIRPWPPHRNWQWSLAPLRDRNSNGSIVILLKSKDFGPRIDVGYGFAPTPMEKYHSKTRKRSMTKKKVIRKFREIDGILWGKCRHFFEKGLKRVVQKFRQKFGPPVSEVLDPLVRACTADRLKLSSRRMTSHRVHIAAGSASE